ncbi:MAG: pseudouridine synthase, partial [Candidatus Binatia bacterium]
MARFVVRAEDAGKRLDVLLAERVSGLSRRRARVLISAGSVFVDRGRVLVHSRRIAAGREIVCHAGAFVAERAEALDPARILYDDAFLVAIDKPAGMASHPTMARRQGTALQLTEEWLRRRFGEKVPLWPLHRLDAGTSGILLFARSRRAARAVSQN